MGRADRVGVRANLPGVSVPIALRGSVGPLKARGVLLVATQGINGDIAPRGSQGSPKTHCGILGRNRSPNTEATLRGSAGPPEVNSLMTVWRPLLPSQQKKIGMALSGQQIPIDFYRDRSNIKH